MTRIIVNGILADAGKPVVNAASRGLRYGDGLFETMRVVNKSVPHFSDNYFRLSEGLTTLGFRKPVFFTEDYLLNQILSLSEKNGHPSDARVRLTVFRDEGGLFDPVSDIPQWIIETWPIPPLPEKINENGLVLDIFPDSRKACDRFSSLKSANFLTYVMAARFARENQLNDALVLNSFGHIADSTIANIFWEENGKLFTTPLSEGPIAGTTRKRLIKALADQGISVGEEPLPPERLLDASSVFLTNAVSLVRWVGKIGNKHYVPGPAQDIYRTLRP